MLKFPEQVNFPTHINNGNENGGKSTEQRHGWTTFGSGTVVTGNNDAVVN